MSGDDHFMMRGAATGDFAVATSGRNAGADPRTCIRHREAAVTTITITRPWQLLRAAVQRRPSLHRPLRNRRRRGRRSAMFMATTPPTAWDLGLDAGEIVEQLRY
jgi:hypothetical protein